MAEDMTFLPRKQILTLEEMLEVGKAFVALGVDKIRLTGGEPLVRQKLTWLTERLGELQGLRELTLTTNAVLLEGHAQALYDSGIRRINVSLDATDPERFKKLARFDHIDQVLKGIETAKQLGIAIRLNSVVLRGHNDDAVDPLVDYAVDNGFDIAFIEEMPLGEISSHQRGDTVQFNDLLLQSLAERFTVTADSYQTGGPARYHRLEGTNTRVGFISPHSNNFCGSCNRVRVTSEGQLLLCLGHENSVDLRAVLRDDNYSQQKLQETIINALVKKPERHEFKPAETHIVRFMNMTGG